METDGVESLLHPLHPLRLPKRIPTQRDICTRSDTDGRLDLFRQNFFGDPSQKDPVNTDPPHTPPPSSRPPIECGCGVSRRERTKRGVRRGPKRHVSCPGHPRLPLPPSVGRKQVEVRTMVREFNKKRRLY